MNSLSLWLSRFLFRLSSFNVDFDLHSFTTMRLLLFVNPFLLVEQNVRFLAVFKELFGVLDQRDLLIVELQPAVAVSD
jgi:hypothetical protein